MKNFKDWNWEDIILNTVTGIMGLIFLFVPISCLTEKI